MEKEKKNIDWGTEKRVDIPNYEGFYEINKLGQIRSYWKNGNRDNSVDVEPQRLLQPRRKHLKKYGDKAVATLFDGLTHKHFYVARLVAEVFLGFDLKDKQKQITHINGNCMDCKVDNIKIVSIQERQNLYYSRFKYPKKN